MAVYRYTATDTFAAAMDGTVVADTPRQARDELRARGLAVQVIEEHRPAGGAQAEGSPLLIARLWQTLRGRGRARARRQAETLVRELATLLAVGLPLADALQTLARQQPAWFRPTVLALRDRVTAGVSLADAMSERLDAFSPLAVAMVEVGQSSGQLETVLEQLSDYQERSAQLRGKVGTALVYPAIVLAVGLGVAVFLMTYVVPELLASLIEAGKPLPWITQVVKVASDLLLRWWWALLVAVTGALAMTLGVRRTPRGRRWMDRQVLKLPGVGELVRKQAVVRVAFVVATLMRSGIAFERAVAIAAGACRNALLAEALQRCRRAVEAGRDIAPALEATAAFPPAVVQVFALGQSSGNLEMMLDRLAQDYDAQVHQAATRLAAALEPILILTLAALVGAVAFATILPILEAGHVL